MKYYVDTCIWLNLFKKEGDSSKGVPYWELAKDFIEQIICSSEDLIFYSDTVLREFQLLLNERDFREKRKFLEKEPKFVRVDSCPEDKAVARKIESACNFEISFLDCVHIVLAKRYGFVLVTRDAWLIQAARDNGVTAGKPEEFTNGPFT